MQPEVLRLGSHPPQLEIGLAFYWGQFARRGSVGRNGKMIVAATQEFVGTKGNTEALLDAPSRVGGGCATRNDSGFDVFADKGL
jgi:hypothetical protein